MKIKKKHIIIGSLGLLALGLMSFTTAKTSQAKELLKYLKIGLHKVRDIGMNGMLGIRLRLDIILKNASGTDFSIDTKGAVQPKVIRVFLSGNNIGHASLSDVSSLTVKAGGSAVIENIAIDIDLLDAGKELYPIVQKHGLNFKALFAELMEIFSKKMYIETDIQAFGQLYTFKQAFA